MSQPMKDKLLIADVDGTLINSGFQVPLRNLEAIEQFQRDGGLFTLATGRAIESARQYAEQIGLSCPAIVSNGSMLFDYKTDQVDSPEELTEKYHAQLDYYARALERLARGLTSIT